MSAASRGPGVRMPTRLRGRRPRARRSCRPVLPPDLPQEADRLRQRELLAGEAGDEAAAADLAARLEPTIDAQEVAPGRQPGRLAREKAPEDDAVAAQERPREMLDRLGVGPGRIAGRPRPPRQRPAPRVLHAEHRAPPPASPLLGGDEKRAQPREAVGGDEAERDQLGERLLDLRRQEPRRLHQLVEEGGAVLADRGEDRLGAAARFHVFGARRERGPVLRVPPREERDRGRAHRRGLRSAPFVRGRSRAQVIRPERHRSSSQPGS